MARFDHRQLEEIRQRADLAAIVARYVTLKRSGRNFVGLCPFHQEKTPSFHVHSDRQFYYCFGCKESGDVFAFLMHMERISFPEAVERLAEEVGVELQKSELSPEERRRQEKIERIIHINQIAARYFQQCLGEPGGRAARTYLEKRGIDAATQKRFAIGYAPPGWRDLLAALEEQGVTSEEAVEAGLAVKREGKAPFDIFRHRIMFPILDVHGRVVGFGGRALDPSEKAKYINTPQTIAYSKSEHLFGLYQAREGARRTGRLIVCEGYTDVTALSQAGVTNVVASLGTAFTAEHAELLSRWAKEVVLAFDADAAGRAAAEHSLEHLVQKGLQVRIAVLPEGEDPDSLVRSKGVQAFKEIVASALTLLDYKIERAFESRKVDDIEGRLTVVRAVLPILADIDSPVAQEAYVELVAERLDISRAALVAELRRFQSRAGRTKSTPHRNPAARHIKTDAAKYSRGKRVQHDRSAAADAVGMQQWLSEAALIRDEQRLLYILLKKPAAVKLIEAELGTEPFLVGKHNQLFQVIKKQAEGDENALIGEAPELLKTLRELESWNPVVLPDVGTYIQRVWEWRMRFRLRCLEKELARLSERDESAYAENIGSLLLEYKRLRQTVRGRSIERTVS